MRLHLPTYLGGRAVELDTDGLSDDEQVVGWVDEYGTIMSPKVNEQIGDIVATTNSEWSALIMRG
jgi:hypothetical protein